MNAREFLFGFGVTALLVIIAVWSVGGDEIIEWGYYLSLAILYAVNCGIRMMIGSAAKDNEGMDWGGIGTYCLGGFVAVIASLLVYWA